MLSGIIDIDRSAPLSLSEQIYRQVRLAVRDRKLISGHRLASSRRLAADLNVSRNIVSQAYELLRSEDIIEMRHGSAPVIKNHVEFDKPQPTQRSQTPKALQLSHRGQALCDNPRHALRSESGGILSPGEPALDVFPSEIWARILRRVSRRPLGEDYLYHNVWGLPQLRQALAEHLVDMRGVQASPDNILITTSTQASLSLASLCLTAPGDGVYMENPGYLGALGSFRAAGLKLLPMDIDDSGAIPPDETDSVAAKLIYVTPSHQYPLGPTLSLSRRLAFIASARQHGALMLEDDYDSEFLFSERPVAALQGLAPENVIYMGTFSKTMLPGLRLGYMVVPEMLAAPLKQAIRNLGVMASVPIQLAMAEFIKSGYYRAHMRRIRNIYKARGEALSAQIQDKLGHIVDSLYPNGGVQLVIRFKQFIDDRAVARVLQAKGVNVTALSATYLENAKSGLIIGFAEANSERIEHGVSATAKALLT